MHCIRYRVMIVAISKHMTMNRKSSHAEVLFREPGGCEPVRTGMVKFTWELPAERTVVR